jgi:flagellin-like hook-associated protein FlgL
MVINTNIAAQQSASRLAQSLARYHILVQAGTAMLAQANLAPQSVLRLLA